MVRESPDVYTRDFIRCRKSPFGKSLRHLAVGRKSEHRHDDPACWLLKAKSAPNRHRGSRMDVVLGSSTSSTLRNHTITLHFVVDVVPYASSSPTPPVRYYTLTEYGGEVTASVSCESGE
ncbi:hypothetical protein EVAR_81801_1 [Eumeta japonica]|uniref:Uncharacterized protein n=1 Tax=Eumeta variegata TaxID=151549 RepID=A0A4C1UIZ3_EUMVA|nr:hypothetical protein EVAR_81801_1 [Eumeta japonica]